jgi:predicted small lipoprotein YifL
MEYIIKQFAKVIFCIAIGILFCLTGCAPKGPAEKIDQAVEKPEKQQVQAKKKIEETSDPKEPTEKLGKTIAAIIEGTKEEAVPAKENSEGTVKKH